MGKKMPVIVHERNPDDSNMVKSQIEMYPYLFTCLEDNCGYSVVYATIEEGIKDSEQHLCPRRLRLKETNMAEPNEYLLQHGMVPQLWNMLDRKYIAYLETVIPSEKEYLGAAMRGMAEALVLVMYPYYADSDAVVREMLARHASTGEHNTPGIGWVAILPQDGGSPYQPARGGGYTSNPLHMVTPPPGYPDHLIAAELEKQRLQEEEFKNRPRPDKVDKPPTKSFTFSGSPGLLEELTMAIASGADDAMIAMAYGATPAQIKWVRNNAQA